MGESYDYHGALLKTNLIPPNTHPNHTANMIHLSPFGPEPDPTEFIDWMRYYRGFRDQFDAKEAAERATALWFENEETTMTDLPEAPYSANFRTQSDVQITVRAADWDTFLRRLVRAEEHFLDGQGDAPSRPQNGGESPSAPQNGSEPQEGDTDNYKALKYEITQRPDDYELKLWADYGGRPGKWPEDPWYGSREELWELLEPVWGDVQNIPSRGTVKWKATYRYGRKKQNSDKRFKDVIRLEKE